MNLHRPADAGTLAAHESGGPRRFTIDLNGSRVPAALWIPAGQPRAIVQACHGGSGHKESGAILAIARALLPHDVAVLAIDGPVHGERSVDGGLDPSLARQRFREAWSAGQGRTSMAEEMSAALDHVMAQPLFTDLPVGYIGVSMGTAYGIPYLARDHRVRAAVIGLWSTTYRASEHLRAYAADIRCPVWFTQQWNDEIFDRQGTAELFDAIGATDKRLVAYPGPHVELEGERLADAVSFLCARLLPGAAGRPA